METPQDTGPEDSFGKKLPQLKKISLYFGYPTLFSFAWRLIFYAVYVLILLSVLWMYFDNNIQCNAYKTPFIDQVIDCYKQNKNSSVPVFPSVQCLSGVKNKLTPGAEGLIGYNWTNLTVTG